MAVILVFEKAYEVLSDIYKFYIFPTIFVLSYLWLLTYSLFAKHIVFFPFMPITKEWV